MRKLSTCTTRRPLTVVRAADLRTGHAQSITAWTSCLQGKKLLLMDRSFLVLSKWPSVSSPKVDFLPITPIKQYARWARKPIWQIWRKVFRLSGIEPRFLCCSARYLVTVLTKPFQLNSVKSFFNKGKKKFWESDIFPSACSYSQLASSRPWELT